MKHEQGRAPRCLVRNSDARPSWAWQRALAERRYRRGQARLRLIHVVATTGC